LQIQVFNFIVVNVAFKKGGIFTLSNNPSVAHLIHILDIQQTHFVHQKLKLLHLNSTQGQVMSFIAHNPNCKQRDVATYLNKQEASVTNLLKNLAERKLIYRKIPNNNGRTKILSLTDQGKQLVTKIDLVFKQLQQQVDQTLTQDELTKLFQLLKKVQSANSERMDI